MHGLNALIPQRKRSQACGRRMKMLNACTRDERRTVQISGNTTRTARRFAKVVHFAELQSIGFNGSEEVDGDFDRLHYTTVQMLSKAMAHTQTTDGPTSTPRQTLAGPNQTCYSSSSSQSQDGTYHRPRLTKRMEYGTVGPSD